MHRRSVPISSLHPEAGHHSLAGSVFAAMSKPSCRTIPSQPPSTSPTSPQAQRTCSTPAQPPSPSGNTPTAEAGRPAAATAGAPSSSLAHNHRTPQSNCLPGLDNANTRSWTGDWSSILLFITTASFPSLPSVQTQQTTSTSHRPLSTLASFRSKC
jgi:hypothetical protein